MSEKNKNLKKKISKKGQIFQRRALRAGPGPENFKKPGPARVSGPYRAGPNLDKYVCSGCSFEIELLEIELFRNKTCFEIEPLEIELCRNRTPRNKTVSK